jgi:glycine betaine/proline transport system substrate-binding protein
MLLKKSLITASLLAAMSVPAIAEDVKIGVPSWTGAQAMAHLLGAVVEMRIGGTVDYVPGNNATIFQGMDQGKAILMYILMFGCQIKKVLQKNM